AGHRAARAPAAAGAARRRDRQGRPGPRQRPARRVGGGRVPHPRADPAQDRRARGRGAHRRPGAAGADRRRPRRLPGLPADRHDQQRRAGVPRGLQAPLPAPGHGPPGRGAARRDGRRALRAAVRRNWERGGGAGAGAPAGPQVPGAAPGGRRPHPGPAAQLGAHRDQRTGGGGRGGLGRTARLPLAQGDRTRGAGHVGVNPDRGGEGRGQGSAARVAEPAGSGPPPAVRERGAAALTAREAAEALWLAAVRADREDGAAAEAPEPAPGGVAAPEQVREPPGEEPGPEGDGPRADDREPASAEDGRGGGGPPPGPGEGAAAPPADAAPSVRGGAAALLRGLGGAHPEERSAAAPPRIAPRRGDQAWLDRALRPFAVPAASPAERVLDEEATARDSAAAGRWLPARRAVPERGHRLLLVREESLAMLAHTGDVDAFQRLVGDRGVFRDVRARRCGAPGETRPQDWDALDRVLAAADPGALLLLCTDGVSEEWRSGRMHALVARWARRHCTAILNSLPLCQWHRGHIETYRARLGFPVGAGSGLPRNTRLGVHLTDPGELPPLRPRPLLSAIPVPVVAFPDGLAEFARFAAGRRLPGGYHTRVLRSE